VGTRNQEDAVANHNQPEERNEAYKGAYRDAHGGAYEDEHDALSDETERSWRPQDPERPDEPRRAAGRDDRDDWGDAGGEPRDARRWESDEDPATPARPGAYRVHRGASERDPGGRYGEERLRALRGPSRDDRPSAGSFEDRYRELGPDAGIGAWPDPTGGDPWRRTSHSGYRGRDFEPERRGLAGGRERMGYSAAGRVGDERIGEPAGSYGRRDAWNAGAAPGAAPGAGRDVHAHVHRGTGPHRGKGPSGYQRSDERLRELVCDSLTDDDQLDASRIEVGVTGGEVTLSGMVDDRQAKRAAEDCAYSVSGVRDVQNRLRVGSGSGAGDAADPASRSNPSGAAGVCSDENQASASGSRHRA
jgi:hypothetical protein